MAELNLPLEVKKVLGKRRTPEGTEYLVQLKGQKKGQERWINYKQLLNSRPLLKEYNKTLHSERQRKHKTVSGQIKGEKTLKNVECSSASKDTQKVMKNISTTCIGKDNSAEHESSDAANKGSKPKKKRQAAKCVQECLANARKKKEHGASKSSNAERQSACRNVGSQKQADGKTSKRNNAKGKQLSGNKGSTDGSPQNEDKLIMNDIGEISADLVRLSDMSDSEDCLYSLADPEADESESTKGSAMSSDSEGVLYSLSEAYIQDSPVQTDGYPENEVTSVVKNDDGPERPRDLFVSDSESDSEVQFRMSSVDVIAGNQVADQPGSEASSSALSAISKVDKSQKMHTVKSRSQTAPLASCGTSHREQSPSLASANSQPQTPNVIPPATFNPSLPNYDAFIRTFSRHQRVTGDGKTSVQRRVSVRNSESAFKYKQIMVKKHPLYTQIWLNSETKCKNALNPKVFQELITALRNAETDDTHVVLLTGSGHVFCSGIDLHYLMSGDIKQMAVQMAESLKEFFRALMFFPKPVVAAVNGSAVGLGVALLPLCDVVYASDKASFYCPYTKLGQTPEGGASFTFTQTMGVIKANELLLEGRRITAQEASQIGLVSQVFWPTSMMQEVIPRVQQMAQMSTAGLEATKFLIRGSLHGKLEMTINTECDILGYLWTTAECQNAMAAFINEDDMMF